MVPAALGGTTATRAPRSTCPRTSTRTRSRATTGAGPTPASRSCRRYLRRGHRRLRAAPALPLRHHGRARRSGTSAPTPTPSDLHARRAACKATCVVSALGLLNYPRYPDWPGLDDFAGPKFHTFRWEHEHDLTGKRVAVVGTGSTATQIVPEIAPLVDHVYLFQREPGWVVPKGDRDFTPEERAALPEPAADVASTRSGRRLPAREEPDRRGHPPARHRRSTRYASTSAAASSSGCSPIALIWPRPSRRNTPTRANDRSSTRPSTRRSCGTTWSSSPGPWQSVTEKGVVDADGNEYVVDVLVMATGFQPANYLASLEIVGRRWPNDP